MALTDTDVGLTKEAAIKALERFVVESDDLAELEATIGRFNIFDALRIVREEIRHSNFLAWLLDPAESHGQGQLFLRAVLMDMLRFAEPEQRPMSPVDLDGVDLGNVQVRREWKNIDILIIAEDPAVVFAIENKIDSGEHSGQLQRYRETIAREFPDHTPMFVFLTREGDEPTDDAWAMYDYHRLYDALSRCKRLNTDSIGGEVAMFLDHYLSMIRSRLMDDPKIDELCDRIYRNHRQALDLIFERKSDPRRSLVRAFAQSIAEQAPDWAISDRTVSSCRFTPKEWTLVLPPINARPQMAESGWIFGAFRIGAKLKRGTLEVIVGPTTDADARAKLLDAIRKTGKDHGFLLRRDKLTDRWTRVYTEVVLSSDLGIQDDEQTLARIEQATNDFVKRAERMTALLRKVFPA